MELAPAQSGRVRLRGLRPADWPPVEAIWAEGIATGNATFEPAPPGWADFDVSRAPHLRLVAEAGPGMILGWAAAGPVSTRRVYAGVAEHSVYVRTASSARGIGGALLRALIELAEATGTWALRSGVFPENEGSLRLHRTCGFREVGRLERAGRHADTWRDVILLERRSARIGVDGPLVRLVLPDPDDDLARVRRLLAGAGLTDAGLDDAWRVWVADADGTGGRIVGSAALERYDDTFLLRSVAVDAVHRGSGLGSDLVRAALRTADLELGHQATVCLLTETAAGWFEQFGFAETGRDGLPTAVGPSSQLRGACPESARAYLRPGALRPPAG